MYTQVGGGGGVAPNALLILREKDITIFAENYFAGLCQFSLFLKRITGIKGSLIKPRCKFQP